MEVSVACKDALAYTFPSTCLRVTRKKTPTTGGGGGDAANSGSAANAAGALPAHSNLYVANLPPGAAEPALEALFAPFGEIVSLRIVRASRAGAAARTFAFVKYATVAQAAAAVGALGGGGGGRGSGGGGGGDEGSGSGGGGGGGGSDRAAAAGFPGLEVKFADADAGERNPELTAPPGDNLYVKNLPGGFGEDDLRALFAPHGAVAECKLLHRGDGGAAAGAGALVRVGSVHEARRAIAALHGQRLPGAAAALVVRFADSAEQKAKRAARAARPGPVAGGGAHGGGGGGGGYAGGAGGAHDWRGGGGGGYNGYGGGGAAGFAHHPHHGYGGAYGAGGYAAVPHAPPAPAPHHGHPAAHHGYARGPAGGGGGGGGAGSGYEDDGRGGARGGGGHHAGAVGAVGGAGGGAPRERESSVYIKYLPETVRACVHWAAQCSALFECGRGARDERHMYSVI